VPGLSRHTGEVLTTQEHLRQSVIDILTTPIGSRVAMRDYGSRLFELTDSPMTPALEVDIAAATIEALDLWEPRLNIKRVKVAEASSDGSFALAIYADYQNDAIVIDGVLI